MENYRSAFNQKQSTMEKQALNLPFEISNQLIIRAREQNEEVIKIFKLNKIQSRYNNDDSQNLDNDQKYPFSSFKKEVSNYENLYKQVKICKTCFILYSMISRYFDKQLKQDLKSNYWLRIKLLNKGKVWYQSERVESVPLNNPEMMKTKSEQKFRITKTPQEKKQIRCYVVPKIDDAQWIKRQGPQTAQNNRMNQAQSQIEINRLALGYLNYQKLDIFKQTVVKEKPKAQHQRRSSLAEENFNLFQELALFRVEPTRKTVTNQAENVFILQLQEDLKRLRVTVTNEIEIRQIYQAYLQKNLKEQTLVHIFTTSQYYYHAGFAHLRKIYQFNLSSPIQPLTDEYKLDQLKELTMDTVCSIMGYPKPNFEIPNLKFLIFDEKTAVPYVLLESRVLGPRAKHRQPNRIQHSGKIYYPYKLYDRN